MCFLYDDYATIYNEQLVRARKEHKCSCCRQIIIPRTRYRQVNSLYDGKWNNWKLCDTCIRVELAIVAHELEEGCWWSEAWPSFDDLRNMVLFGNDQEGDYRRCPEPLRLRTLEDCRRYVDDLFERSKLLWGVIFCEEVEA
jgi:hypothetical protein